MASGTARPESADKEDYALMRPGLFKRICEGLEIHYLPSGNYLVHSPQDKIYVDGKEVGHFFVLGHGKGEVKIGKKILIYPLREGFS